MAKLGCNWAKVKKTLKRSNSDKLSTPQPAKALDRAQNSKHVKQLDGSAEFICDLIRREKGEDSVEPILEPRAALTAVLAMDCEMVGVGPSARRDALARVTVVNFYGNVVLDTLVKPMEAITDHRTQYSGIGRGELLQATPFKDVQQKVADIIQGRILVGHALRSDLKALMLSHPRHLIRDTINRIVCSAGLKSLKHLSKEHLQLNIQEGEHDSVEDARAALALYKKFSVKWEKKIAQSQIQKRTSR